MLNSHDNSVLTRATLDLKRHLERIGLNVVSIRSGRLRGLYVLGVRAQYRVYDVSCFYGRDIYTPWFEIHPFSRIDSYSRSQILSDLEKIVWGFSEFFNRTGKAMVPYLWDDITVRVLDHGYPEESSDLGYILVKYGYYLLTNMYYPEGFYEGSPKIVGEGLPEDPNKWYVTSLIQRLRYLENEYARICVGKERDAIDEDNRAIICTNLLNSLNIFKKATSKFEDI